MADLITISDDLIRVIPHKRAALAACLKVSGLPPKVVASEVEIDRSGLTKMLTDTTDPRHFPPEKENLLMDICRNEIPLSWALVSRGYPSLREVVTMQAELAELRAEVARLRADKSAVTNVFKFIGD